MWVLAVTLLAASCVYSAGLDRSSTSGPVIHNRTTGDLKQVLERAAEFPLALHFTLYGPPEHPDGTVHHTKRDEPPEH